ncbi:MAG: Bsp6I family type II restriction endonuclease [Bacilli bacterium]
MKIVSATLFLDEKQYNNVPAQTFDRSDIPMIHDIYRSWRNLCTNMITIQARSINIPEGLSEAVYCLITGSYRINSVNLPGANSSFDCYSPVDNSRVQVKACSVIPDLTSFGPHSVWDKLIFIDFYANGQWNGAFIVYEIPSNLINNLIMNMTTRETFRDQQAQGRRPRLSLYRLIQSNNIPAIFTGNIYNL